jgi:hypothetical protein
MSRWSRRSQRRPEVRPHNEGSSQGRRFVAFARLEAGNRPNAQARERGRVEAARSSDFAVLRERLERIEDSFDEAQRDVGVSLSQVVNVVVEVLIGERLDPVGQPAPPERSFDAWPFTIFRSCALRPAIHSAVASIAFPNRDPRAGDARASPRRRAGVRRRPVLLRAILPSRRPGPGRFAVVAPAPGPSTRRCDP